MKENLYGVILEPPTEAKDVLKLLQKLDQAEVDYIMPRPGTVAVLGSDLLKIYDLLVTGTHKRVVRWSGDQDPRLGWWVSSSNISDLYRLYSGIYQIHVGGDPGPRLKFTYDDYPLFAVDNSGIVTGFPSHIYWRDVLNIIHMYGFKDENIRTDDPIWGMAR
jgi:hypothetical protein